MAGVAAVSSNYPVPENGQTTTGESQAAAEAQAQAEQQQAQAASQAAQAAASTVFTSTVPQGVNTQA